jgi:hypothetical protein
MSSNLVAFVLMMSPFIVMALLLASVSVED